MALEACTVGVYPEYLGSSERLASFSEEQSILMNFCHRLTSSCNVADVSPNDIDETRQQAKLLMSLMIGKTTVQCNDGDRISSLERSSSDQSFTLDDSFHSASKRDKFSFVCPSLSLENSSSHSYFDDATGIHSNGESSDRVSQPAHLLLGRSLKVDDPDALRLSADAMARNVVQSFQKSLNWRIHAWVHALSKKIVKCEHQMLSSGATIEDLKTILDTPEAMVIVALKKLTENHGLAAEGVTTSFEVLSQRIDHTDDGVNHCSHPVSDSSRSSSSISSSSSTNSDDVASLSSDHSTDTIGSHTLEPYSYASTYELRFCCTVQMQTPVGFTEIAVTVPGTIVGSFESSELDPAAQFKSVTIDLDTNVLASLIDKACRTIVRSSVETIIAQPGTDTSPPACPDDETSDVPEEVVDAMSTEETFTLSSPPANSMTQTGSAFVTPGPNLSDDSFHTTTAPSNILFPIPDDLPRRMNDQGGTLPRRISPQPISRRNSLQTGSGSGDDSSMVNYPLMETSTTTTTRPSSLKRRTPPPMQWDECHDATTADTTTAGSITSKSVKFLRQRRRSLPLISPSYESQNHTLFDYVPDNGPSIPMLVEAACQIANTDSD